MAVMGIVEIVLHFDTFRNIDLFHQGIYHLRARIYQDLGEQVIAALPYAHFRPPTEALERENNSHFVLPGYLIDEAQTFATKSFMIKYCEEEVDLNEAAEFRLEMDLHSAQQTAPVYLEVELLFEDPSSRDKEKEGSKETTNAKLPPPATEGRGMNFKIVSYTLHKLHRVQSGMHEYVSLVFDEFHFCTVGLLIHTALIDFRFRLRPSHITASHLPRGIRRDAKERPKAKEANPAASRAPLALDGAGGGALQADSDRVAAGGGGGGVGSRPGSSSSPSMAVSFAQYLRESLSHSRTASIRDERPSTGDRSPSGERGAGAEAPLPSLLEAAEGLHQRYMHSLARQYHLLACQLMRIATRCFTPPQRIVLGEALYIPPLAFPGEEEEGEGGGGGDAQAASPSGVSRPPPSPPPLLSPGLASASSPPPSPFPDEFPAPGQPHPNNPGGRPFYRPESRNQRKTVRRLRERMRKMAPDGGGGGAGGGSEDAEVIAAAFGQELSFMAAQLYSLWHKFLGLLIYCPREMATLLRQKFERRLVDRLGESLFRDPIKTRDVSQAFDREIWDTHSRMADALRRSASYIEKPPLPIEDVAVASHHELHPILFEQTYEPTDGEEGPSQKAPSFAVSAAASGAGGEGGRRAASSSMAGAGAEGDSTLELPCAPKRYQGVHLFVLVHGFQGNSYDMRLLKSHLTLLFPELIVHSSTANEDATEGCIGGMGELLAKEVRQFVKDWAPGGSLSRLSFVAHSLGGLIVRAALPHLKDLWEHLYLFMTLSSPHLGYMYNSNKLVDAGMWVLKTWRRSLCLQQLSMTDAKEPRDCFIYKLSKEQGLSEFKFVALVSSWQDNYAPFDSARIEVSSKAAQDAKFGPVFTQMAKNLLGKVNPRRLIRFDVNYKIPEKNLDTFIGRAAHIQFLENQVLMRMLLHCYAPLFK